MKFFLQYTAAAAVLGASNAFVVDQVTDDIGVSAFPFHLGEVTLTPSRWTENQARTLAYLKWIDVDRLLYVFRQNHGLSTGDAEPLGGWDAPDFPFRSHIQGHFLTAWTQCFAVLGDAECGERAEYFVKELAKCQGNNEQAGFSAGYLSGFPESEIEKVHNRTLDNGNVPYYAIHKTMVGLLDVWRHFGNTEARDVLLSLASWVKDKTGTLSPEQQQEMLQTEFGGMTEILADIYHWTGDSDWIEVARRFDHAAVLEPLSRDEDRLEGTHANTQLAKWIGAIRQFKATGDDWYERVAFNAWNMTTTAHTFAIGGNSIAEHFREPFALAENLATDTAEGCNTYNMLKLTRELWLMYREPALFDFYERALINHLLGQQDPESEHGHITYFTALNPGGHKGVGPWWGGGSWSRDEDTFWCCQGTGLETNTKLMDSIYFHDEGSLYVNLFTPSTLTWAAKNTTVIQTTAYPKSDSSTLEVRGSGSWAMHIRVPAWAEEAEITVNGDSIEGVSSGAYATIERSWTSGDVVVVRLPMKLRTVPTSDRPDVRAMAYGPVILAAAYEGSEMPTLDPNSVEATDVEELEFQAVTDGKTYALRPFYDTFVANYTVYWDMEGF